MKPPRPISRLTGATDEELRKIVEVARLAYGEKRLSQSDIAKELDTNQSTISRWLVKAQQEGIVTVQIHPPPLLALEEKLSTALAPMGVHTVRIVPNGPIGSLKNEHNIGEAAAELLSKTIRGFNPTKNTIGITISCGKTLGVMINHFVEQLYVGTALREWLTDRTLEFFPAALYGSARLEAEHPHSLTATLATEARAFLPDKIVAYAPTLPEGFYKDKGKDKKKAQDERDRYCKKYGIKSIVDDKIIKADIFVVGIGMVGDKTYRERIKPNLGLTLNNVSNEDPELVYCPIDEYGNANDEVSNKIVGVTVDVLRVIAREKDRHVIALTGGESKRNVLARLLKHKQPPFNTLVCDAECANNYLNEH